jgi:predicted nucleic acid-binding protein
MIVADSNIVAYFYIEGEHTDAATALYKSEPEWAVPALWRSEFRNILAGYFRRGTFTLEDLLERQLAAETQLIKNEYQVDSRQIFSLIRESNCTAYDCEFIALAITLKTKLITMDAKLLRAFPQYASSLYQA